MSDTPGDVAAKLEAICGGFLSPLPPAETETLRAAASMLRECAEREKALREALAEGRVLVQSLASDVRHLKPNGLVTSLARADLFSMNPAPPEAK